VNTPEDRRGRWWPWAVVALIALMALMMGVLMWSATGDPTHVVVPDYYDKAVRWDETAARREASARLGWRVELDFRPVPPELAGAGEPRPNTLVVATLRDSLGQALDSLDVRVRAFFSARADRVLEARLAPRDGAYAAALRLGPPGLWEFHLEAGRDSTLFVWDASRDLGAVR